MIFSIISWLIFGLLVGALARLFMPGVQSMGWPATIVVGVVGSFVGGGIKHLLRPSSENIDPAGWIMSIVGAMIVLWVVGRLSGSRRV